MSQVDTIDLRAVMAPFALALVLWSTGCVRSPCDGQLVDDRERCGDSCGFAVHRLATCADGGDGTTVVYRCIAPELATDEIRCWVHTPTGDLYRFTSQPVGSFPDADDWRACTADEEQRLAQVSACVSSE